MERVTQHISSKNTCNMPSSSPFALLAFLGSHSHPSAVSAEHQNEIICAKQKDKAALEGSDSGALGSNARPSGLPCQRY